MLLAIVQETILNVPPHVLDAAARSGDWSGSMIIADGGIGDGQHANVEDAPAAAGKVVIDGGVGDVERACIVDAAPVLTAAMRDRQAGERGRHAAVHPDDQEKVAAADRQTARAGPLITSGPAVSESTNVLLVRVIVCGDSKTVLSNWISLPAVLVFVLAWPITYGSVPESPEPELPPPVELTV